MTESSLIVEIMVWGLLGLIALLFTIPSVSSYLLEKITGIKEEENFDLNGMIKQNQDLFKLQESSMKQSALEVAISLSQDERLPRLMHEFQWEPGEITEIVLGKLSDSSSRTIDQIEYRAAIKKLMQQESFEEQLTLEKIIDLLLKEINSTKTLP
jgi:hypothetical protein